MRTLMLLIGISCLAAGCGKKNPPVAKNDDTGGGGGGDGFMVMDGGRMVTGGGGQPAPQPQPQPQPAPRGINDNTNFRPGGTALGNVYRAGKRASLMAEMADIGKQVMITVQLDDRMPPAAEIKQDLQRSAAKYAKLIDEGIVILTNTTDKTGLWAYEIDSDKVGGIALIGGTASRKSAEEITAMLRK